MFKNILLLFLSINGLINAGNLHEYNLTEQKIKALLEHQKSDNKNTVAAAAVSPALQISKQNPSLIAKLFQTLEGENTVLKQNIIQGLSCAAAFLAISLFLNSESTKNLIHSKLNSAKEALPKKIGSIVANATEDLVNQKPHIIQNALNAAKPAFKETGMELAQEVLAEFKNPNSKLNQDVAAAAPNIISKLLASEQIQGMVSGLVKKAITPNPSKWIKAPFQALAHLFKKKEATITTA